MTSKIACCRMCARLQDYCNGSVVSSRLLPARIKKKDTKQTKLPLLPTSPEGAHKRPPMQGVLAAGRQNKAAGPTRSRSMPPTRDFPATSFASCPGRHSSSSLSLLALIAISIAMPAPVLGGGRVSDAGARLAFDPMTRPKLVCACLPLSPDHVSLPREHAGG